MGESDFYPRLCGGTLFTLILRAMKRGRRTRSFGSDQAQMTAPNCLADLITVVDPEYVRGPETTFDSNTSAYRKCELAANTYLPFDETVKTDAFDKLVRDNYPEVLQRMTSFVEGYIEDGVKSEWLVRALIELIQQDKSITNTDPFFVTPDGVPTMKANLVALPVILLPAFLLGIWHYVIVYKKDNCVGQETYQSWHEFGTKGSRPKFISSIGNNGQLDLKVVYSVGSDDGNIDDRRIISISPSGGVAFDYSHYLDALRNKYNLIKTILYDTSHPFRDFYVCNDVLIRRIVTEGGRSHLETETISNITIEKLREVSSFCIITGTGGLGKSMMMRHLLLDAVEAYEKSRIIPVFVSLREYASADVDITDFLYTQIQLVIPGYPREEFIRAIGSGSYILLLDGLDEINTSVRGVFESKLEQFSNVYGQNLTVLSSRPYSKFQHLSRYNVLSIRPFTKPQALELISRLDYDETAKTKFYRQLDESLFHLHKDFAENPLLLTIMLMTYDYFADIPSQIHYFYQKAYETMAQKHDAVKDGIYKRVMRSNLTPERFEEYLAEFCAVSYTDEQYALTEAQAAEYLEIVKNHIAKPVEENLRLADFMDDLINGLCLMYESGGTYYFTHRSFQEYFTAVFMSNQMDDDFWKIGQFFEEHVPHGIGDMRHDKTFLMLYDMKTKKVERFILRPYLDALFQKCDSEHGYWTFLDKTYGYIGMESGNVSEWAINEPQSFLYNFIAEQYDIGESNSDIDEAPYDDSFVENCFVFGCDERGHQGLVKIRPYEIDDEDSERIEGWNMIVQPLEVCEYRSLHKELYEMMDDDEFPFKREYNAMRRLWETMRTEQDRPRTSLRSLFGK